MAATDQAAGEVCNINIGPGGRARRFRFGLISSAVAVAVAAALLLAAAPRAARLVVFLPALVAGYGFFQAREKT